jgi:hypothetical protein
VPDFTWKHGDTATVLFEQLQYATGQPIPVEGASVQLRLRSLASAAVTTLTGTAEFLDGLGNVQFTPSDADTQLPVGNYIAEWVVTFPSGQVQPFPQEGYLWGRIVPNVISAPQLIVSLEATKEHLGIQNIDRTRDSRIIGYIQAITPLIEAQTGPMVPKIYEEWFDGGSNIRDVIRQPSAGFGTTPLFKVLAVSEYRGPIEYPLSLVSSPAFGSIYSVFVDTDMGTITRRTAGGRSLSFMPGRQQIHMLYQAGQTVIPDNVTFAAMECVRVVHQWTRQVGRGSEAQADIQEVGPELTAQLSRMIRMMLMPTRRFPAVA